jgi:hypothetical protein
MRQVERDVIGKIECEGEREREREREQSCGFGIRILDRKII